MRYLRRTTPWATAAVALILAACAAPESIQPTASSEIASEGATPTAAASASEASAPASVAAASPDASQTDGGVLGQAQSCQNDEVGFVVAYPEGWWANDPVEPSDPDLTPIPGCTYFAPEPVELQPNAGLPEGIHIWFDQETQFEVTGEVVSEEETTIDGRPGFAVETESTGSSGFEPEGTRTYRYIVDMGDGSEVLVSTSTQYVDEAEYEEAKPILDAMMGTLDFDD